jgi:hypothetical protein
MGRIQVETFTEWKLPRVLEERELQENTENEGLKHFLFIKKYFSNNAKQLLKHPRAEAHS